MVGVTNGTASASAASAVLVALLGNRVRTIIWICSLAAWPVPTTVFLMRFGGYS
jgi:hypothetical protein